MISICLELEREERSIIGWCIGCDSNRTTSEMNRAAGQLRTASSLQIADVSIPRCRLPSRVKFCSLLSITDVSHVSGLDITQGACLEGNGYRSRTLVKLSLHTTVIFTPFSTPATESSSTNDNTMRSYSPLSVFLTLSFT